MISNEISNQFINYFFFLFFWFTVSDFLFFWLLFSTFIKVSGNKLLWVKNTKECLTPEHERFPCTNKFERNAKIFPGFNLIRTLSCGNIKSPPSHSPNDTSQQKPYLSSSRSIWYPQIVLKFTAHIPNTLNNFFTYNKIWISIYL